MSQCQKRTSGLYGAMEINRGRHTDHLAGRHSIRTNQCPPPPSPYFLQTSTRKVKTIWISMKHETHTHDRQTDRDKGKERQKKYASLTHMDGSIVFPKWRRCASYLIHASLSPPESTIQTASRWIQPLLNCSWHSIPIFYNGRPFPTKLPLPIGDLVPWAHHGS